MEKNYFYPKSCFSRYRNIDPNKTTDKPTPTEFVQFILDSARIQGPLNLDNHIKPMWASCPFCSVEFDVIGRLENFDKYVQFIFITMGITVIKLCFFNGKLLRNYSLE